MGLFDDCNRDMTRPTSFVVLAGAFATLAGAAAQSAAPAPERPAIYAIPQSIGDGWTTVRRSRSGSTAVASNR